jgi:hypothetical protein
VTSRYRHLPTLPPNLARCRDRRPIPSRARRARKESRTGENLLSAALLLTIGVGVSIRFWHLPGLEQGNDALNDAVRAIKRVVGREAIDIAAPEVANVPRLDSGFPPRRSH